MFGVAWTGLAGNLPVVRRLSTVTGPAGVGKATLARAVLAGRNVAELDGPTVGALESGARLQRVTDAVTRLRHDRGVLLVTDLDALLPAEPEPVSTLILDELRRAVDTPGVAFVATTAHPDALDDRTRGQDVCDRELTIPLPDGATRRAVLELMLKRVPTDALDLTEIASRAPGFVAADLAALVREAGTGPATP